MPRATLYSAPAEPCPWRPRYTRARSDGAPTNRRRRNRAGASAALGRQPRRPVGIRAGPAGPRRRARRHRRHPRAPRRGRHRGRVRLRPDGRPAARRRPGPDVPPAIYAGILARRDRDEQLEQLAEHGIGLIDLVVVNVKPFAPEVGRGHIGIDEAIEMIDVAGAALLGAAARNAAGVVAVPIPAHYPAVLEELQTLGQVSRRHPLPARRGRVQHRRGVLRGDRGLPQPDLEQHLPVAARAGAREGQPTCPTARTRTSARRSTARRPTAPGSLADATQLHGRAADVQQPARPRRRVPHRGGLHGARPS